VKKYTYFLVFVLAAVVLAACSSLQVPGAQSNTAAEEANQPAQAGQPIEDRLAIGILALEGTDQAVTPEQAQTLLPLWKAVKSLSASETASAEEISALYDQIKESMTEGQIQAIQELNPSPEDTMALMEKYGVQMQLPEGAENPGSLSADERATRIAQFRAQGGEGGQLPPAGAPPGGQMPGSGRAGGSFPQGGAMPGGGQPFPGMQGTPDPSMPRPGGFRGGFNLRLVDPLIKLLEERAGS